MATGDAPAQFGVRGYRVRNLEKTEQRKRDILAGASRAFARKGYESTNLDDIAAEAGLAKGHIYHYFLNKEQLFTEIRVLFLNESVDQLEDIVRREPAAEHALRKAILASILNLVTADESQGRLLAEPPSMMAENREQIRRAQRRYERLFLGVVERGIASGAFVPGHPKLMAFTLMRGAQDVAIWYRPGSSWTPQWVAEQVTDQLMRSVLA